MTDVGKVTGIGPALAAALASAGFATAESLAAAAPERIAVVPGIGRQRASRLIAAAKALIGQGEAPATPPRPLPSRDAPVRKVKAARPAVKAEAELTVPEPPAQKLSKPARKAARAAMRARKVAEAAMAVAHRLAERATRKAEKAAALAAEPAPAKKPKKKK